LIGDLVTGADGAFRGTLAVPSKLPRGTGDLFAETVGDAACGLGTSAP
jgi:hypothetical protein